MSQAELYKIKQEVKGSEVVTNCHRLRLVAPASPWLVGRIFRPWNTKIILGG
ncbi:MAG: hypothetical protein Q8P62_00585 [Candidatus Peregrinibacteria bacterium]|nr:hypothetical protein [Candidatus Peregrinibacteria bacterium]